MVAIWAVACFGKFHPDVVVKVGLVAAWTCPLWSIDLRASRLPK